MNKLGHTPSPCADEPIHWLISDVKGESHTHFLGHRISQAPAPFKELLAPGPVAAAAAAVCPFRA